ncbi:MAG: integrase arm-type DNA-binding domain-containing protein [Rhizobiaceae bacterium]|nr:integrase arm-type DNA-binding domain-containing protein [Rhizobiaceae bacterium]
MRYSDSGGLYLQVSTQGSRLWRMAYRFAAKQKTLSFGKYPSVTLADARQKRDQAKTMIANGIDPSDVARQDKQQRRIQSENTFGAIAAEFLAKLEKENKAETTIKKKRWMLSLAASYLNHRPITEITAADILIPLRSVEGKGNYETARRLRAEIGQVFRYAIATARAENDPTFGLRGALITPVVSHRAAFTDKESYGGLLRAVWSYEGAPETCAGLKLMAFLYPRPGELRQAEWSEFDLENAVWEIPKERMKTRRPHKKPLSKAAIEVLKAHNILTGHRKLVFPSYQSPLRPMSENTLNAALRRMGFTKSEVTAHGFRASASSLLNESGLWAPDAVEAELSHIGADEVRNAYHRATYWEERVKMCEWWAEVIYSCLGNCH